MGEGQIAIEQLRQRVCARVGIELSQKYACYCGSYNYVSCVKTGIPHSSVDQFAVTVYAQVHTFAENKQTDQVNRCDTPFGV